MHGLCRFFSVQVRQRPVGIVLGIKEEDGLCAVPLGQGRQVQSADRGLLLPLQRLMQHEQVEPKHRGTEWEKRASFEREGGATWGSVRGLERAARTDGAARHAIGARSEAGPGVVA